MRSILGASLLALCLSGGTALGTGCSNCSTSGQDPVEFTGGITNESRTIYQSSAIDGEWLHFPQGRIYELKHGLGAKPFTTDVFVSFTKTVTENYAPSAGNQAVFEPTSRDDTIRVRNDTCAEFFIRVVAFADPDSVASGNEMGDGAMGGQAGN